MPCELPGGALLRGDVASLPVLVPPRTLHAESFQPTALFCAQRGFVWHEVFPSRSSRMGLWLPKARVALALLSLLVPPSFVAAGVGRR